MTLDVKILHGLKERHWKRNPLRINEYIKTTSRSGNHWAVSSRRLGEEWEGWSDKPALSLFFTRHCFDHFSDWSGAEKKRQSSPMRATAAPLHEMGWTPPSCRCSPGRCLCSSPGCSCSSLCAPGNQKRIWSPELSGEIFPSTYY